MKMNPPIVLLGTDCLTGLQTSRILWRKGVPVIGIAADRRSPYCRTRSALQTVPTAEIINNPRPLLLGLQEKYGARPVVLACTDEFVWWLDDHCDAIRDCADFLLPSSDTLQLLADKARFYRYAMEHHLPLSETRFVTHAEDLKQAACEMSFPLILKPPRRTSEWMDATGGFKVLKVDDAETLIESGTPLLAVVDELILQAWVPGPDINTRELSICLNNQSSLLAGIALRKIRQWPPDVGTGSLSVEMQEDDVMNIGLELLQKLNYIGVGQLEFKKNEVDSKMYLIEMNAGRVALNFPLCEACGVEMMYTYYCAAAGLPLPETRTVTRPGSKWIC